VGHREACVAAGVLFATHELHILDPCRTYADDVQLRARIRRTQDTCSTHIGLDVDRKACFALGRPFVQEKSTGGDAEVVRPTKDTPEGDGTKGCCAFGIRYFYYVAGTELRASTRAGVSYALQNIDTPTALHALNAGPISFDRILKEKQQRSRNLYGGVSCLAEKKSTKTLWATTTHRVSTYASRTTCSTASK